MQHCKSIRLFAFSTNLSCEISQQGAILNAGRQIYSTLRILQMQGAKSTVLFAFCKCGAPNPLYSLHFGGSGRQIHCTLCTLQMEGAKTIVLFAFCRCRAPDPLYSLHFPHKLIIEGRQIHCTLCNLQMEVCQILWTLCIST